LDTTVNITEGRDDTFIITGDINAMWLRDSTNQVMPYVRFAKDDVPLGDMLCGLVRRQARLVLLNPYANAYRSEPGDGTDGHPDDETIPPMTVSLYS
jgi:meiotically up-regulated gene 157 (Mug157) protein